MTAGRTALVVVLPRAGEALAAFRERYDPAFARRIPAHVTLLFPLVDAPPVAGLYDREEPFDVELSRIERFPADVWLAPEPCARFLRLIELTTAAFPDHPPYGGRFSEPIPHLRIGSERSATSRRPHARSSGRCCRCATAPRP